MSCSGIGVGVIGCGYWGPNLVRNFHDLEGCEVVLICDRHPGRAESLSRHYPGMRTCTAFSQLISDPEVDAVAIATPVSSHYSLARESLEAGKHVLVEKPLASNSEQARELVDLSLERDRVLMVGHTYVYHGAVRKIQELVQSGELGELLYLDSTRTNWGILQDDINVVWDLAPHDISIMDFLLAKTPLSVSATGASHTGRGLEDVAFLTLHYPDNLIGHVNINWLSPVKVRTLLLGGSRKMIVYDDNEPSEKVRVYDRGILPSNGDQSRHNDVLRYRTGDVFIPKLDLTEALQTEVCDFRDSILEGRQPLADGESGLRIVRLVELACESLVRGGVPLEVR